MEACKPSRPAKTGRLISLLHNSSIRRLLSSLKDLVAFTRWKQVRILKRYRDGKKVLVLPCIILTTVCPAQDRVQVPCRPMVQQPIRKMRRAPTRAMASALILLPAVIPTTTGTPSTPTSAAMVHHGL